MIHRRNGTGLQGFFRFIGVGNVPKKMPLLVRRGYAGASVDKGTIQNFWTYATSPQRRSTHLPYCLVLSARVCIAGTILRTSWLC
ncbi:hypothetical protein Cenrod_0855 [Candidatus Symbiobacter mobilis CR]|uniref:Uncharacterized protein n=1 Tax=Candidatus Symbiobacter mobilis CR TaxID=946483 RepID=U5N9V2_9BURK|nr:hypothetical protein Cenrod_0855 [Candidatus Symbiobacter mobilis CR]